ncbi:MAG: hypothetical protein NT120_04800 [Candidatus Aenigmarchaeota archaeon]|nr:hypothetical protein [Candidatus Aenigmarchaeota archaeon]
MKKEKLIKALLNASGIEEGHSIVITKFFLEDFDWSGFDKNKVKAAKEIILVIKKQSENHDKILKDLVAYADRSDKDDF